MTLIEIVLAVAILAMAFLPIIGAMGSAMKGGEKDKRIVTAMHMAQSKLNAALQFPFNDIPANKGGLGTYGGAAAWNYATNSGRISLTLGPESGLQSELVITDEPVSFTFQTYDPVQKSANPGNPAAWGWTPYGPPPLNNVFHKYILTVKWNEKTKPPTAPDAEYKLISFKARIVE
ncbi:hypothetical protein HYY75_04280 [bacterium]|nr:hypothetical protein [bacterium]